MGIQDKSENFNIVRPILFELCKKNYRRGGEIAPPPNRNRVKIDGFITKFVQHFTYLTSQNNLIPSLMFEKPRSRPQFWKD